MPSRFVAPFQSPLAASFGESFFDLHREMNRLLDDFAGAGAGQAGSGGAGQGTLMAAPKLDVRESDKEICVCAELPGVKPSDVDVRLEANVLTVRGEKKNEVDQNQQDYHVMERSFGRFQRMIQLPFAPDPDQVHANFEHGLLTIHLPKQPQPERSRRIEIQAGDAGEGQRLVSGPNAEPAGSAQEAEQKKPGKATHH